MQSTDDLALFLRKTPFLTRAEALIPQKPLRGKAFLKLFMKVVNSIYKEQTHKNSLQMDEAVRLHQADENVICWTGGHTHDAGQDDRLVAKEGKRDQRVVMVNSGTYIPTKFGAIRGKRSKKRVEFNRTLQPRGGVVFKAKFDPSEIKQVVQVRPLSGDNSSYNFYKAM